MKFSKVFFAFGVFAALLSGCKKEEPVSGDPSIKLDKTEITLSKDASTASIALTSNRDWNIKGTVASWITITPTEGKASSEAQTVTIAADANTESERTAEITFSTGSATAVLKVVQPGSRAKGDGSKENPFNVAEAIVKAQEIGQDAPSTEYYYIKGYITSISEVSTSYGNATFYIGDTQEATTGLLYCFQVKYIGGASFTSADQINVGDEVVMYAQIYNFKGNTPETSGKGASYIYTLNGQGGGEEPDPSKAEAKTIQEFISLADNNTYYKLTGTITSAVNETYCSFDMADATGSITVWNVVDSCITKYATVLKQGYKVTLAGKYTYYQAQSKHEVTSAVILGYEIPEHKTITTEKVSDAIAAEAGDTVILNNALVVATAKTGYLVTDSQNTDHILVYQKTEGADTPAAVGDKVNVKAVRGDYNSMPQLNTPATTVVSSGAQVTWPTPEDITSTFDSFTSSTVKYVSYEGKLSVSGSYYNITVDGATKIGSILATTAADAYIGLPNVTFKGYYLYTANNKYIYTIFTEAQMPSDYLTVSPTSTNVAATAGTTEITVSSDQSWTAASDNSAFTVSPTSGTGNGTVTVTYTANSAFTARTANITFAVGGTTRATTVITQAAAQDPSAETVELTNAEIITEVQKSGGYGSGYVTISSTSGEWTGNMNHNTSISYIQIRNKQGSFLKTPLFTKDIEKVEFTIVGGLNINTQSGASLPRQIYAIPVETELPTTSSTYSESLYSTNYGFADTSGQSADFTATLTVSGSQKQLLLIGKEGANYIKSVKVYLKSE